MASRTPQLLHNIAVEKVTLGGRWQHKGQRYHTLNHGPSMGCESANLAYLTGILCPCLSTLSDDSSNLQMLQQPAPRGAQDPNGIDRT